MTIRPVSNLTTRRSFLSTVAATAGSLALGGCGDTAIPRAPAAGSGAGPMDATYSIDLVSPDSHIISPSILLNTFLSKNPKVKQAMKWWEGQSYDSWPAGAKTKLTHFFVELNNKGVLPLSFSGHPPNANVSGGNTIFKKNAEEIYLAQVAHSLYIEITRRVPWQLAQYDTKSLELLFSIDKLFGSKNTVAWPAIYGISPAVIPSNPIPAHNFMIKNPEGGSLLKGNQKETIFALVSWMLLHLCHGYVVALPGSKYPTQKEAYGYKGPPIIDSMITRKIHPDTSNCQTMNNCKSKMGPRYWSWVGCQTASSLIPLLLKSLNIPATSINSQLDAQLCCHRGVGIPFLDLYLPHTDDIYCMTWNYGFPPLDPAKAFISKKEFEAKFDLKSPETKRSIKYNHRIHWIGGMQPTYDYLHAYYYWGRPQLEKMVAKGHFTKTEIDQIEARLIATIKKYGGFANIKKIYEALEKAR